MKYVEQIKSVVLLSLIILSVSLTFSIWTYSAKFEVIDPKQTVEVAIANKKVIEEIIKPYKLLFHFEDGLKGTTETDEIDHLTNTLKKWSFSNLELADLEFSEDKLNTLLRKENRFTLYFQGDVPISVYKNVLNLDELISPDFSFDRIVIDFAPDKQMMEAHFVSSKKGTRYSAQIAGNIPGSLLLRGADYPSYVEANPEEPSRFIAVLEKPIELIRNTSLETKISPLKFRDALFNDPNAVKLSQVGANHEEYKDDHALMGIDTANKKLSYVHPSAESNVPAVESELLLETIDFVNEHSGWTDDFRYSFMDSGKRRVKYQLYVHGLPVYGDTLPTEIEQVWGEKRIFRYMRPYYTLDLTIPFNRDTKRLISGKHVAEILQGMDDFDFEEVQEITPGYFIEQDEDTGFFMLEPFWYYMINDYWIRFSPEHFGGEPNGLE